MVEKDHPDTFIKRQCELLSISRSGIYYQPKKMGRYAITLKHEIDQIHTQYPFYGYRKMAKLLNKKGYVVNHKRIGHYLREMRIMVFYPKKNLSR